MSQYPNPPIATNGKSALVIAQQAVRAAADPVMEAFRERTRTGLTETLHVQHKGRNDLVTDIDRSAEAAALSILNAEFPTIGVLAEESGKKEGSGPYQWILDPIDGTRNFVSGFPHFAVSLALAEDNVPILGVIYDPIREELFHAERGKGAWLNGNPIKISDEDTLEQCVLGFDMGYVDDKGRLLLKLLLDLWPNMQAIRFVGSIVLGMAYVSAGRLQLYAHHHAKPWDIAAGMIILQEAGGITTNFRGDRASVENECIIASSQEILDQFLTATEGAPWRSIT